MRRSPPSEPEDDVPAAPPQAVPGSGRLDIVYQEEILQRFRHPHGKGVLESPDASATVRNPLCGEEVSVTVAIDRSAEDDRVRDVRFESDGCSITQASASMMTELARGHTTHEIDALATRLRALVSGDPAAGHDDALGAAVALRIVARVPARIPCAMLAWDALSRALHAR
jgi:nitrogen fixation NifU-like protein